MATGQVVGNEFGRCDHERTCGYDKRPTGKDVGDKDLWISGNKCIRAYRPPVNPDVVNYIPFSEFERTVVPDDRNTVFRFYRLYGEKKGYLTYLEDIMSEQWTYGDGKGVVYSGR